jgi:hypothetical protein
VSREIAVVGGGPAGLMAAEMLSATAHRVTVYERMPSPARKLLMAGRGGLNLTHSEPIERFVARYGRDDAARRHMAAAIEAFSPAALIAWAEALGQPTFKGSSGRIFPKAMKASPLLRAWLRRLDRQGVRLLTRHEWTGWVEDGALTFRREDGSAVGVRPDATLLALGGASWPRLGGSGAWLPLLAARGVATRPFEPSNAGVEIGWSARFAERFAGTPLKRIALTCGGVRAVGEAMVTRRGLEGNAVYALSEPIRRSLADDGKAELTLDLRPDLGHEALTERLSRPRDKQSLSTFLRKAAGLPPVAIAVLREGSTAPLPSDAAALAARIKALPLAVRGLAGIERAISSVGGVALEAVDERFMLRALPSVFVAGEMLDWDAPTGGYLLQATLATAVAAARGIEAWLGERGA